MSGIHDSSFGREGDTIAEIWISDHVSPRVSIISPSHLYSNRTSNQENQTQPSSPNHQTDDCAFAASSAGSQRQEDSSLRPSPTLPQPPVMDFGGLEQIVNVENHHLEMKGNMERGLDMIEEEDHSVSNQGSASVTERSLINSLLTKEDGLEFYERNSSYDNNDIGRSPPGSQRNLSIVIRGAGKPDLIAMPEIKEEIASSATSTFRAEDEEGNPNDKTISDVELQWSTKALNLRLNYDRSSVYGPNDYTCYYPRTGTPQAHHFDKYKYSALPETNSSRSRFDHLGTAMQLESAQKIVSLSRQDRYL